MGKTKIPYAGTNGMNWPVVQGCSGVDESGVELRCKPICWMRDINHRFARSVEPTFHPEHLADPFHWREPRRILMNFTGDTFDRAITDEQIAAMFGVVASSPKHQFIMLTKQAKRMEEWFAWLQRREVDGRIIFPADDTGWLMRQLFAHEASSLGLRLPDNHGGPWPLRNLMLGVSVMGPDDLWRVDALLSCPAAVRFISAEPLVAGIDLRSRLGLPRTPEAFHRAIGSPEGWSAGNISITPLVSTIDWVVTAGDSSGRMPHSLDWFRKIRDDCAYAGVPFMLKDKTGFPELDGRTWKGLPGG